MTNYEKIKLALFAIEHNAYIFQQILNDELHDPCESEFINDMRNKRKESYDKILSMLEEVMEYSGNVLSDCDAYTPYDLKLLDVPYDIVYGRKVADDYKQ